MRTSLCWQYARNGELNGELALRDFYKNLQPVRNECASQANAVSDKLMDLRSCVYTGKNLSDKVLSGALVSEADFSNTVMNNATMTKAYAKDANFSGKHQQSDAVMALSGFVGLHPPTLNLLA